MAGLSGRWHVSVFALHMLQPGRPAPINTSRQQPHETHNSYDNAAGSFFATPNNEYYGRHTGSPSEPALVSPSRNTSRSSTSAQVHNALDHRIPTEAFTGHETAAHRNDPG
jgi:hypothetical protein